MTTANEARVAIVQAWMPHYRKPFFDLLLGHLAARRVGLSLFYGQPNDEDAAKKSAVHVPWARQAPNRVFRVGRRHVTWQTCFKALRDMDLVVCEQSTSQLLLYPVWARYVLRGQRLALWGHGRNFQEGRASPIGEAVKHTISRRVHWWFAYNEESANVVHALGFPPSRITNVQNAVDTKELQAAAESIVETELTTLRTAMGLPERHVGLYVGAMYREKRIPYLLQACVELRRLVPDFHMLFVGAGPDEDLVARAAAEHPWIHHLGARFGRALVPYFLLADVHLMPGLVGLTLLDSFALRTPLLTVADSEHSPEITYLEDGENGVILSAGTAPTQYARVAARLLLDDRERGRLVQGCARASMRFTVEAMSERFAEGVVAALNAPLPTGRARATRSFHERSPRWARSILG